MSSSDRDQPKADARTAEFLWLLALHDLRLHAFVLSLVPSWADAQDIAQEVRLALWEQFDDYDASKDFGTWSRTIAYYKILTYRKRSARQHAKLSAAMLEQVAQHFQTLPDDDEDRHRALVSCLRRMRNDLRDLLSRHYGGEHSLRELAEQTDRSYDAVRQSVVRARKWLGDCIERTMREEERR